MINEILKAVDIKRRKHTHVRRRYSFSQNSCSFIFWCSVSVFFIFSPDVLKIWRKLKAQNLLEEQFPSPFTENVIWQEYTYFYISFREGGGGACTLILRVLSHFPDSLPFPVIYSRHISSPFLIFDIINVYIFHLKLTLKMTSREQPTNFCTKHLAQVQTEMGQNAIKISLRRRVWWRITLTMKITGVKYHSKWRNIIHGILLMNRLWSKVHDVLN